MKITNKRLIHGEAKYLLIMIRYGIALLCSIFLIWGGKIYAQANPGPGLGNLTYTPAENFTMVSPLIDDTTNFLPPDYPGSKHFGVNVMTMLNGYMIGIFAPDSGGGPGGFIALDVSNPRSATLVKQIYEPDTTNANRTGNGERTKNFREPHSFGLSTGSLMAIQTGRGVEIWDWSDVNNPVKRSQLDIAGVNFGDYSSVSWQLFWQAPYLYVARGDQGITIVNTSNVDSPTFVKTVPKTALGNFNVGPIFALGNTMYISSMETTAGFSILDISDPENPSLVKTVSNVAKKYYASCWDGKKAVFSTRGVGNEMVVYDTTTTPMSIINNSLVINEMLYCSMQDDYVFQGNQDDITKVDVSNPANYTTVGAGNLAAAASDVDHGQVFPFGNLVWVGNDHGSGSGLIAHQTAPDNTSPSIVTANPNDGSVNQPLTTRIGVSFSDSILMESVTASSFRVRAVGAGSDLTGTYSVNLGYVNFHPASPLATNTTYTVTIDGIQDFAGNPIASTLYQFSTGATIGHNITLNSDGPAQTGAIVSFTAHADPISGGTVEYSWDFGDGSPATAFSTSGNATYTYTTAQHWVVTLTVREGAQQTQASIVQTVYNPLTATQPTRSSTIIYDGTRAITVNEDNDTVTAISGTSPYAKLWETSVGDQPRTLAKAPNGNIWVVNQGSASISVLNPSTGATVTTYALPRASRPYGVAFSPDGSNALVTLESTGKLLKLNPNTGGQTGELTVGDSARGIAITGDSQMAYITRFISPQAHAEVIEVNLSNMTINNTIQLQKDITTVDAEDRSRGVPNYLTSITIAPDGNRAWIPSNKNNVDRGEFNESNPAKKLTFESTVRAIASQIDLLSHSEVFADQLDFDDRAQPKAIQFSPFGDYVMVAMEGQNSVEIRDAYTRNRATEIIDTGLAPRGLALDGNTLYVHNFMSRSISIYDLSNFFNSAGSITQLANVSTVTTESLHARVLKGKQIFYNAKDARMTQDGYLSCASCHADGDSDDRVWDFTDRGEGLRNTISLLGRHGMGNGNVHWTANFDEIQDFENDIRGGFNGTGFMTDVDFAATQNPLGANKAGSSVELDNLAFYVGSLNEYPKSPYRNQDGSLTADAVAGQTLFSSKGCHTCHSDDFFTDNLRHDVGTIQPSSGQGISQPLSGVGFDTPTLIGVWKNSPYFHNGQAATLDAALQIGTEHTISNATERQQLVAYLQQIEYIGPPIVVSDPPAEPQIVYLSDLTENAGAINGWGPFEKDRSNGEQGAADGSTLTINGVTYTKGLGVHANSEIVYDLSGGDYDRFFADIGVDDENSGGSVVFEVWVDGNRVYQSATKTGADPAESIQVNLTAANNELKLIVTDAGDGVGNDHADWADAKLRTLTSGSTPPPTVTYLSDLTENAGAANGWGPFEKDRSNGEQGAADGNTITIQGVTYSKGLGVHANSTITYTLPANTYERFQSDIGVDDETCGAGSVVFKVWADSEATARYTSPTLTQSDAAASIDIDASNVTTLKLEVTDGGNGVGCDHADWANARLTSAGSSSSGVQYVKLVATSEVNGNPWTSVAELNILVNGSPISQSGWSVTVDSEELVGENTPGTNAVDGNMGTFWHTEWQASDPVHPHEIQINLGSAHNVSGFRYLPRQNGANGRIAGYTFHTSTDGVNWTQVASGTFPNNATEQEVTF